MTTLDPNVYRQAANLIRNSGHIKRAFVGPKGEYCTLGAILKVTNSDDAIDEYAYPLAEMLGKPLHWQSISGWNDAPQRTPEDCITLLNQAAEKLEANR